MIYSFRNGAEVKNVMETILKLFFSPKVYYVARKSLFTDYFIAFKIVRTSHILIDFVIYIRHAAKHATFSSAIRWRSSIFNNLTVKTAASDDKNYLLVCELDSDSGDSNDGANEIGRDINE